MLSSSSSAALSEAARSALGPVGELAHLFLQFLDRDRHLLEELVHLIGVVPPKAGTKLTSRRSFADRSMFGWYRSLGKRWWMPRSET